MKQKERNEGNQKETVAIGYSLHVARQVSLPPIPVYRACNAKKEKQPKTSHPPKLIPPCPRNASQSQRPDIKENNETDVV